MPRVFIGLGSNEGNRLTALSQAAQLVAAIPGVQLVQMAPIRETEPVGGPEGQERYLNTAIEVSTSLAPAQLLQHLKAIERHLGRPSGGPRWGPRPIDLDLLLYGDLVVDEPALQVPHPRLAERRFVLEPLAQLAPDLAHPVLRQTIAELRAALDEADANKS